MGLFKQKQSKNSDINYMELTPYRKFEHEFTDDGESVNILVPKYANGILAKYVQPKLKYKFLKADLDKFGTATWLKIDGKSTVLEIAEKLIKQFGEEIQPINKRLTIFLTQLYKSGFISFNELERK